MSDATPPSVTPDRVPPSVEAAALPFPATPLRFSWWVARTFAPWNVLLLLLITVLSSSVSVGTAWVIGRIIDTLTQVVQAGQPVTQMTGLFVLLLACWCGGPLLARLYTFANAYTNPRLVADVNRTLFGHVIGQSSAYFQNTYTGALTQRIRSTGLLSVNLIEIFVLEIGDVAVSLLVAGVLIGLVVPDFALYYAGFALLFLALTILMARRILRINRGLSRSRSEATGHLADAVGAVDVVQSHGAAARETEYLGGLLAQERHYGKLARIAISAMRVVQLVLTFAFMGWLVWSALSRASAGTLSVGAVATLLTVGVQLAMSITRLGDILLNFFAQVGDVSEALAAVAQPHTVREPPSGARLAAGPGAISFQHVRFGYSIERPLFADFSLDIAAGERVALVGPSGSGKSSLLKILTRRYDVQAGDVLIDGQRVSQVSRASLALAVAEVTQSAEMLNRSILENIRYGRPGASRAEVIAAARAAQCHDFIMQTAEGYESRVGERGVKLSGGERQRLAIARAILKDAPILLLDEATSALDSEAEALIQQALAQLMQGRTVLAIAHRLSTVASMDRILYMERGRVIETGTHAQLLAQQGAYARLWSRQVEGFAVAAAS